jgi:hypothetical protein
MHQGSTTFQPRHLPPFHPSFDPHPTLIRRPLDSHPTLIRLSSDSHSTLIRFSSDSHPDLIRFLSHSLLRSLVPLCLSLPPAVLASSFPHFLLIRLHSNIQILKYSESKCSNTQILKCKPSTERHPPWAIPPSASGNESSWFWTRSHRAFSLSIHIIPRYSFALSDIVQFGSSPTHPSTGDIVTAIRRRLRCYGGWRCESTGCANFKVTFS